MRDVWSIITSLHPRLVVISYGSPYISYEMPTGVIIYGDKVATVLWGETPTAFVIQSKKTAEKYRKFFYNMWKIAKS